MKKIIFFAALICSILAVQTAIAQVPVASLEHGENASVFYGQNSFVDAYNASANGDIIYLSTGFFNPPEHIGKSIKIIGAGHFPDSANVAKRTTILNGFNIFAGADSLLLVLC